jgi:RimJ/RimL family protein N-acetyltransferase
MPFVAPMTSTGAPDFRAVMVRSERLMMRSFVPADAAEIFAHTLPAMGRYIGGRATPSLDSFEHIWRAWLDDLAEGRELTLVARRADTLEFVGITGLSFRHGGRNEPEVGVWIKESAWGHGYGAEAVGAVTAWGCNALGLDGVFFSVVEVNEPSRRIAEGLGGVVVGRRVQRQPGGSESPMVVYRIPQPA